MSSHTDESCPTSAIKYGGISAGIGLVVSSFQNSFDTHSHGAKGVFTRTGGTIGFFAAMGGVFAASECVAKQVRQVDDPWNGAIAGCAAGLVVGIRAHSIPAMCIGCATIGTTFTVYEYMSGNLKGVLAQMSSEEKQKWKQSFFKEKNEQKDE